MQETGIQVLRCALPYVECSSIQSLILCCRALWQLDIWRNLHQEPLALLRCYAARLGCAFPCSRCAAALCTDLRLLLAAAQPDDDQQSYSPVLKNLPPHSQKNLWVLWRQSGGRFGHLLRRHSEPKRCRRVLAEREALRMTCFYYARINTLPSLVVAGALIAIAAENNVNCCWSSDVHLVVGQTGRTISTACHALLLTHGDVVDAIMGLTK